jgi:hypothetical protein
LEVSSTIEFRDWQPGQVVNSPVAGVRYVLLRTRQGAVQRTLSANPAISMVTEPPSWQIPVATINGAWNPSGQDGAPHWATIVDAYGVQFNQSGNHVLSFGTESFNVAVNNPPPQPDKWQVDVLWWDTAWLHNVLTCRISYNGTSNPVRLDSYNVPTSRIYACDIERTDSHEFYCTYNDDGSADVYVSPAPSGSLISTIAIIIGDTK